MKRLLFFILIAVLLLGGLYIYKFYLESSSKEQNALILYGNVDIRQVDLGFRVSGRVQTMAFQEGDLVPQDSLMALLDKQPYEDQVRQASAHVESVEASLNNARLNLKRRAELLGTGAVAEEDYDQAISSQSISEANLKESKATLGIANTNLSDTELYAPSDGVVLTRIREPGTVVRESDPIYTLSLVSPVWIRAYVSEPNLGRIYPGMRAEIYTDTPNEKVYHGHIGFISPVAEFTPKTVETTHLRTDLVYRLRIIADNPDQGLRQGMPVTVKLPLQAKEEDLAEIDLFQNFIQFLKLPFVQK